MADALLICDDDVSSPSSARRSISGIFSEEDAFDGQVSVQEMNNVERERESSKSWRENSFCGVCLISCHLFFSEVIVGVFIVLRLAPKGKSVFSP